MSKIPHRSIGPSGRRRLVDDPSLNTPWHWLTSGKTKAKALVKFFEAIKKFAEE